MTKSWAVHIRLSSAAKSKRRRHPRPGYPRRQPLGALGRDVDEGDPGTLQGEVLDRWPR